MFSIELTFRIDGREVTSERFASLFAKRVLQEALYGAPSDFLRIRKITASLFGALLPGGAPLSQACVFLNLVSEA